MGALPQNDGRRTAAANEVIKKYGVRRITPPLFLSRKT